MLDPEKPTTISGEYPRPFIISVLRVFALKAKQTGAIVYPSDGGKLVN